MGSSGTLYRLIQLLREDFCSRLKGQPREEILIFPRALLAKRPFGAEITRENSQINKKFYWAKVLGAENSSEKRLPE